MSGWALGGVYVLCFLATGEGAWRVEDVKAYLHTLYLFSSVPVSVRERDSGGGVTSR